jgi:hypothetical protein
MTSREPEGSRILPGTLSLRLKRPGRKVSRSHVTTDGQSVSMSRCRAHSGTCDQILLFVRRLFSESCLISMRRPLWREARSVICRSHVTTGGQSVIMSRYRAHSGTCDQILLSVQRLLSESCCFVSVGRPLWREARSVICRSHVTTDGQSVIMSRYRAHSGTCDQILLSVQRFFSESCCLVSTRRPLWREAGSVICHSQSILIYQYLHQVFTLHVLYSSEIYIQ